MYNTHHTMYRSLLFLVFLSQTPSYIWGEQKCCPDNECYELGSPWILRPPPRCLTNPVEYILFTRSTKNLTLNYSPEEGNSSLESVYDSSKPTILIFHGWMQNPEAGLFINLVESYLISVDANVILLDYANVTTNLNYPQVVSDIRVVNTYVIKFVNFLISQGTSVSNIQFSGLSVGVHLASYVAKAIPGISRLTGMDPVGPLFEGLSCEIRFCKEDAIFTEAIYTNGLPVLGLGTFNTDSADLNFILNGGWTQPLCWVTKSPVEANFTNIYLVDEFLRHYLCSHVRSAVYLAEALSNNGSCTFWGVKANIPNIWFSRLTLGYGTKLIANTKDCTLDNCAPMGKNSTQTGTYIVPTNGKPPYCVQ